MMSEDPSAIRKPLSVEEIPVRDLLREQDILDKFLKGLQSSNLPTLHDSNVLKVTRIQNALLE